MKINAVVVVVVVGGGHWGRQRTLSVSTRRVPGPFLDMGTQQWPREKVPLCRIDDKGADEGFRTQMDEGGGI